MVVNKLEIINKAYDILKNYQGNNGYIIDLKNKVYVYKNSTLNDFQANFIINNKDFEPKFIGKQVKLAKWFGEKKQKEYGFEFVPKIAEVGYYMGETDGLYVLYLRYRKSQEHGFLTICKKDSILTDFLAEDYNNIQVDFERYDNLAALVDETRKINLFQKEAVKFLLSRKKCILALEAGFGKTLALTVAALEGNFDSIIVICPASIKTNWKRELMYYVPEKDITIVDSIVDKNKDELEKLLGYAVGKSGLKKNELIKEANERGKWVDNRFVIVNYDILDEFFSVNGRKKILDEETINKSPMLKYIFKKKSLIIIDEAHKLSNKDSIRYKVISGLIKRGKPESIYLATGTPVTNNPENLYHILKLINHPVTEDYNNYMKRYCGAKKICHPKDKDKRNRISSDFIASRGCRNWYDLSDKQKEELNQKIEHSCRMMTVPQEATNLDELKERISTIYLRRTKDELDNIVKKEIHEMFYDLTPSQQMEYNRLWDEYEQLKKIENPDKELSKDLLEGAVYRKYISNLMVPHTEYIVDKLNKRGEKVVVACCYDEELYTLKDYYGEKCVVYNGKMSIKEKDLSLKRFYEDDNVMVILCNIASAGVGINLVNSRYVVFNNMSYVYADNSQMEDRVYRITQKRDCHIVYQMFRGTQYEHIWNTSLRKKTISEELIKKEIDK